MLNVLLFYSGETRHPLSGICSAIAFDSRINVACDCSGDSARGFQDPPGNTSNTDFAAMPP